MGVALGVLIYLVAATVFLVKSKSRLLAAVSKKLSKGQATVVILMAVLVFPACAVVKILKDGLLKVWQD